MQETNQQVLTIIIAIVILLVIIGLIVLLLAVYYSNTKKRLIREKDFLKATYEQAIMLAQLEIQEQTLRNVSQEIHDNIGQVLSYVSLSLERSITLREAEKNSIISESKSLVNQSMNDLRDLSKSFSLDTIASNGLVATIRAEVSRLNKSRLITAELNIEGTPYHIGENQELVLFRILQEFTNNTLKHSKAKNYNIDLEYDAHKLSLTLSDDGIGFDANDSKYKNGSGLKNMRSRAALIGAEIKTYSAPGKGALLQVELDKQKIVSL